MGGGPGVPEVLTQACNHCIDYIHVLIIIQKVCLERLCCLLCHHQNLQQSDKALVGRSTSMQGLYNVLAADRSVSNDANAHTTSKWLKRE